MQKVKKKDEVDVVFASDEYYFPYIYIAVETLYENNKNIKNLNVHYIEQDVSKNSLDILNNLASKYQRSIDIRPLEMPEVFMEILPNCGPSSKTTYAKFWFASMFPDLDRLLYLDPDVLVLKSIEDFYNIDFEDNLIAGVIENLPTYHTLASKMKVTDHYINGGMVLCNLKLWREEKIGNKFVERLKDTSHNLNYDQGILNEVCRGKILIVPPKYNALAEIFEFKNVKKIIKRYGFQSYYSQAEVDEAVNDPVIIHFTHFLYGKPLSKKCDHPYANYYRKLVENSPVSYALNDDDIDKSFKIRKLVLRHMPFKMYLAFENMLDRKRKKVI